MHAALADNIERRVAGGVRWDAREQRYRGGDKQACSGTAKGANGTFEAQPTSGE
ncbi:MAG TPA: hypothetical protein VGG11_06710 [Xanthobacteraceae bacterium]|jgi:hypothetical protein